MTKKVLILCQRKSGPIYVGQNSKGEEKYDTTEAHIVPKINKLVQELITTDYDIDYLSTLEGEHSEGEVDIQGFLSLGENQKGILTLKNKGNEKISTRDFIQQNKGSYALIILNTCPFVYMDYNIIYDLLAADGLMAFTAYPREAKIPFEPPKKLFVVDALNNKVTLYKKNQSPTKSKSPAKTTSSSTKRRTRKTSADVTPPHKVGGQRKKRTKKSKKVKKY
jgi:hypothetical protein